LLIGGVGVVVSTPLLGVHADTSAIKGSKMKALLPFIFSGPLNLFSTEPSILFKTDIKI
jgi:hypothetical protein